MSPNFSYLIFNKPYGVLSQFTDKEGRRTLKEFNFPADIYPVGRLDMDSEGLLLLTNDKHLINYLLNPVNKHEKEYLVQVEGEPRVEELKKLEEGLIIEGKKTSKAKAKRIREPFIWDRIPPIRKRKSVPVSWLSITLIEGKNRQVRKMTAQIGFPTLRLIRIRIKNLLLSDLKPGQFRELLSEEIQKLKAVYN